MRESAPYLIPIPLDSQYLESWTDHWGKNVGIFLTSSATPDRLLRHLREIFVVKDEGGQEYFFRFYDPRVLRVFLPTCTLQEAKEFFGPIGVILSEAEAAEAILKFSLGRESVQLEELHPARAATAS
jgi:hypothetical protein